LLYELLSGVTPFDSKTLREAGYGEIQRIIREVEPPKPSTRLNQSSDDLPRLAKLRHAEPKKLSTLLRGELDWIVMKSLEKDRTRRYETASDLAEDIERYLDNEPVRAAPPSRMYRFNKLVRRNKAAFSAAAVVAIALILGIIGTSWGMVRANAAVDRAEAMQDMLVRTTTVLGNPLAGAEEQDLIRQEMSEFAAVLAQTHGEEHPDVLRVRSLMVVSEWYQALVEMQQGNRQRAMRVRQNVADIYPKVQRALPADEALRFAIENARTQSVIFFTQDPSAKAEAYGPLINTLDQASRANDETTLGLLLEQTSHLYHAEHLSEADRALADYMKRRDAAAVSASRMLDYYHELVVEHVLTNATDSEVVARFMRDFYRADYFELYDPDSPEWFYGE